MPPRKEADDVPIPERTGVERLDLAAFAGLVRKHRGALSLRQAAKDAGVSFSTMSRVEAGQQPDLASFTKLSAWIGQPPSKFFTAVTTKSDEPLVEAITHLSRDPRLVGDAAGKLISALTDMYEALASKTVPDQTLVACHLRAASVMRPGVPQRLGDALVDMHNALEQLVSAGKL
jgi:transcriptional regulator with XRE-family HTH domain